jgi:hypothetical protein
MKRTKAFLRNGRIKATDYAFTGEEPVWDSNVTDLELYLIKAFGFYNYYLEKPDFLYALHEYMVSDSRYGSAKASLLTRNYPQNEVCSLVGSLARMATQGAPVQGKVRKLIDRLLKTVRPVAATAPKKTGLSPIEIARARIPQRSREKVQSLITDLEALIDSWTVKTTGKIREFDIIVALNEINVEKEYHRPLQEWIKRYHDEYQKAYDKSDEQLVEGFSYLSKPALKNRIKALQIMSQAVDSWKKPVKARKPRKKRVKTADKQIKSLKFAPENDEFNLNSINPVTIPGSQHLYVFNTRYKTLNVYHAEGPDGFTVKGCTLQNFDSKTSYVITLRKPKEILPQVAGKTPKQIEKIVSNLTTKKKTATGRINGHCILHRVLGSRKSL